MPRPAKIFTFTGQATKPEQLAALRTHHNQIQLLMKAASWKRAHELYLMHQGFVGLSHLRQYGSISGNQTQLAVSADATEGIWWSLVDSQEAEGYHALWKQPAELEQVKK